MSLLVIIVPVLFAVLVRLALLHWTGCRSWPHGRHAITLGAIAGISALLLLPIIGVAEWLGTNGLHWAGMCPGGPPDIPAHPCTFNEALADGIRSPFALAGFVLVGACWTLACCSTWFVLLLLPFPVVGARQSPLSIARAFALIANAAAVSLVLVVGGPLLVTALGKARENSRASPTAERFPSTDYLRAWGLPEMAPLHGDALVTVAQRQSGGRVSVPPFSVKSSDRSSILGRWPRQCWHEVATLPPWLWEDPRKLWNPPHDRAPRLGRRDSNLPGESTVFMVGMRLSDPKSWRNRSSGWADSFEDARRRLERGEVASEWFTMQLVTGGSRDVLWIEQRGYANDLRDWQPICRD